MGQIISTVTNPKMLSRFEELACEAKVLIEGATSGGLTLARGCLLGTLVGSGKFRPYVEGSVKSGGAFGTGAATFTLDVSLQIGQVPFQVGDVIESSAGAALGTIATYNAVTGVGTLTGNSSSVLGTGGLVRVALSVLALSKGQGRVLKDQVEMDATADSLGVAYFEGFFVQANTTITAAALAAMSGKQITSAEVRLV